MIAIINLYIYFSVGQGVRGIAHEPHDQRPLLQFFQIVQKSHSVSFQSILYLPLGTEHSLLFECDYGADLHNLSNPWREPVLTIWG